MRRPDMLRRCVAGLTVLVAVLGLSGCFKASQDVRVRSDGTGSVTLHADLDKRAFDKAIRDITGPGSSGGVPSAIPAPFKPVDQTFPDGTKVRAVDGSSRATLDASFDFEGPDDYRRKLKQVSQAVSTSPEAALPDDGSLETRRVGDRMEVILDVGTSLSGTGELDFAALLGLLDRSALPKVVVSITMPGRILETNGTPSGRTATWDLLSRDAPATLRASSTVSRPGLPAWAVPVGAGLVALLLIATLGVLLAQRRRPAAAEGVHQPGTWPPAASPGPSTTFFPPPAGPAPVPHGTWPGADPASQTATGAAPVPGWYADPAGGGGLRYWDGSTWTQHTT